MLNKTDIKYINAILLNDESSTDDELINLFMGELKINKELSKKIVSYRNNALIDFKFNIKSFIKD